MQPGCVRRQIGEHGGKKKGRGKAGQNNERADNRKSRRMGKGGGTDKKKERNGVRRTCTFENLLGQHKKQIKDQRGSGVNKVSRKMKHRVCEKQKTDYIRQKKVIGRQRGKMRPRWKNITKGKPGGQKNSK